MRKIYVDIFYCKRHNVKKAINEYLQEIESLGGIVCPTVIYLNCESMNPNFDTEQDIYRIISVQRSPKETRIVVNLSCKVNK